MSCVLRIEGENFKVHEFIAKSNLKPYMAYTKGEKLGFVRRGIDYQELNGCAFDLSMADFDNFDLQKKDTIEFLEKNFKMLKMLPEFGLSENEIPIIDFGIYTKMLEFEVQSDYLEPKLLKLAGELNFGIEISQYIEPENEN